jgi:hypothetical protein
LCGSTTGSVEIFFCSMRSRASVANCALSMVLNCVVMTSVMEMLLILLFFSKVLRRSPSVNRPMICCASLTIVVTPRRLLVISIMASLSDALWLVIGSAWRLCIICSMVSKSLRPRLPAGCENAKSCLVNCLACNSVMAMTSPRTSIAVVLEVGARLSGHASLLMGTCRLRVADWAKGDVGSQVMAIMGTLSRFNTGIKEIISLVCPELDRAMTTSCLVIMPKSPWLASPACTNCAGLPVLANVAAILRAICPDFPIPMTIILALQLASSWHEVTNVSSMVCVSAVIASASVLITELAKASISDFSSIANMSFFSRNNIEFGVVFAIGYVDSIMSATTMHH